VNIAAVKYLILLLSMWLVAGPVSAEIYKWTDENGQVNYSDSKPKDQEVTELEFAVSTYESVSYGTFDFEPAKAQTPKTGARKKVVIFSASWCGACRKAKTYFRRKGIPYIEYDIEKGKKAKQLYSQLGATEVPVILVGNKRMNGFSEAGFERIYR
jgi:glutaredoxin